MFSEFRAFIARGNVLDLAVGVIIGAAFGKIVSSLTDDIIMPVIGWITGGIDFSSHFIRLGAIPAGFKGDPTKYADLKAGGVATIGIGSFVTAVINFLILAFVIFLIVRQANRILHNHKEAEKAAPTGPSEIDLLTEIRDELKKK